MPPSLVRRSLILAGLATLTLPCTAAATVRNSDIPYIPTPNEVVAVMLDMAELKAGERLIDLGSGDGRIPIAAARRGASALGVEINPRLVARARSLAEFDGQSDRARFQLADLFTVSLRDADVVTLYLLPQVNERLRPKLLVELRPGARVVSHAFDMGDWAPDASRKVGSSSLYLWTIPAVAGGIWRLTRANGTVATLTIQQRYNRVTGTLDGYLIEQAHLHGTALSFIANGVTYRGKVGERAITNDPGTPGWRAERVD